MIKTLTITGKLIGSFFVALFMLNIIACSEQSPLTPSDSAKGEQPELNFVTFKPSESALNKGLLPIIADNKASAYISKYRGGRLHLVYDGLLNLDLGNLGVHAEVTLDVAPHAVDRSTWISLELNESTFFGNADMEYSPHGLIFNEPAILNLKGSGLDLSDVDPEEVEKMGFYYVNQETGKWEPMVVEEIRMDKEAGTLQIINAELPHFSRYAVAWAN